MEGKEEQSFHQLVQHTCSYDSQLRQVNCVPFIRTFIQISSSSSSSSSNKNPKMSKRIEITHLVGSKLAHLETDKLINLYVDIALRLRGGKLMWLGCYRWERVGGRSNLRLDLSFSLILELVVLVVSPSLYRKVDNSQAQTKLHIKPSSPSPPSHLPPLFLCKRSKFSKQ